MADPDSQFTGHVVGVVQMVGGALEIALGAGGLAAPTGVTQVGGVILIAHGADTFLAGFRSIYYGQVSSTYRPPPGEPAVEGPLKAPPAVIVRWTRKSVRSRVKASRATGVVPSEMLKPAAWAFRLATNTISGMLL
jgi:hypothetical protein